MNRKHLILPAVLLGASVLVGGQAAIGSLPLGTDAASSSSKQQPALTTTTTETEVAQRTQRLDAQERAIAIAAKRRPPALPTVTSRGPSANAGPGSVATSTRGPIRVASAPGGAAAANRPVDDHGGGGRDHPEDDGTIEHPVGDDHGVDATLDDHGGTDVGDDHGGGSNSGSGHGGGHGGGDDD